MRRASLYVSLIAFVILLSASRSLSAQCKNTDPSGRFDGSATSSQAGKLDISLNLVCDKGSYAGTLNTPIGVYVITTGSFTGSDLKLGLSKRKYHRPGRKRNKHSHHRDLFHHGR